MYVKENLDWHRCRKTANNSRSTKSELLTKQHDFVRNDNLPKNAAIIASFRVAYNFDTNSKSFCSCIKSVKPQKIEDEFVNLEECSSPKFEAIDEYVNSYIKRSFTGFQLFSISLE
ncbi:hypothetical protein RF11_14100 [Thelohanellus kitauei]|uniref:Uncharacterized protein n=1 Tax=Thelohanellus kitauei TaxID=669202 RepID=A0A0C2J2V6_THEKT|nr:hypothetical protein RF11_14100 [Thelohanellus kitauei]